jgi:hypothetical protein
MQDPTFLGPNGSGVDVLLGNGDGTFQAAVSYAAGYSPSSVAVAGDFNGDVRRPLVRQKELSEAMLAPRSVPSVAAS